jgi:SAM-dependent methyltransferase
MTTLFDIVYRQPIPEPWEEAENIPWNEPGFSERMLREHLSQHHNAASRRLEIIGKHVDWIHDTVLAGKMMKILDLGCGPGLYSNLLAAAGHECVGIDYSPASIAYARNTTQEKQLACTYVHQDLRVAEYGTGYGLAMLIFGEFNVFRPSDAQTILKKAHGALADDGILLLEPHTFDAIQQGGEAPRFWYSSPKGLFLDTPHLCLQENFWNAEQSATTTRHFILDAATDSVTRYAQSMQAYTNEQYQSVLNECGFHDVTFYPSLFGEPDPEHQDLMAVVARKCP